MKGTDERSAVWAKILETRYESEAQWPHQPAASIMRKLARLEDKHTYLAESWTHVGDTLPSTRQKTGKVIHRAGTTAMIDWIPMADHQWTGLLETGGPGVLRASITSSGPCADSFAPAIAIKVFIDEQGSENLVAAHTFEGFHPDEHDFFKEPMRTTVPPPGIGRTKLVRRVQWNAAVGLFRGALAWRDERPDPPSPFVVHLGPFCSRKSDGTPVEPHAPDALEFRLAESAESHWDPDPDADFRRNLADLPADLDLLEVVAAGEVIGLVRLASPFVPSRHGDEALFFQHIHEPKP